MCRSSNDTCGARRCKSREEERIAKAVWRASKKLKEEFSGQVSPKTEPSLPLNNVQHEGTMEERVAALKDAISQPRGWRSEAEYDQDLAATYIELGSIVHAEAGSAAEEEFNDAFSKSSDEAAKRIIELDLMRNRIDEIDAELDQIWVDVDENANINRDTYPVIVDRVEALKQQLPEVGERYSKLKNEQLEVFDKYSEARRRNTQLLTEDESLKEVVLNRRQAYINALEKLGVEFAEPGTRIEVKDGGNEDGEKHLNAVVQLFPKAWVDASNESAAKFTVEQTASRGKYSIKGMSLKEDTIMSNYVSYLDQDWEPDPREKDLFVRFDLKEHYDPTISKVVYQDGEDIYHFNPPSSFENTQAWFKPKYVTFVGRTKAGMPTYVPEDKTGWEEVKITQKDILLDPKTGKRGDKTISRWQKKVPFSPQPEELGNHSMLISKANNKYGLDGYEQTAAHEFCHRIEFLKPEIVEAEKAFLYHRAKLHTEEPERVTQIQPNENGYKDNFANHYSGRIYPGAQHYELLSTGIEKLFFGAEDGYAGLNGYEKDDEYRNFVLGLLASTRESR